MVQAEALPYQPLMRSRRAGRPGPGCKAWARLDAAYSSGLLHQGAAAEVRLADVQVDHAAARPRRVASRWRRCVRRLGALHHVEGLDAVGRAGGLHPAVSGLRGFDLGGASLGGGVVEHAVDVLVPVGAAEALGQFHGFVDGDLVGDVEAVLSS